MYEALSDKIMCTPPVNKVNFSCNSSRSTSCQISKPVTNKTAYCIVGQNETITTEVTIKNTIGRTDTKAETAGNVIIYNLPVS